MPDPDARRAPARWRHPLPAAALLTAACALPALAQPGAGCAARSGAVRVPVVELYTSEGCNSCPPADRWLSRFVADPNVVALAFHVDYWDRLGWERPPREPGLHRTAEPPTGRQRRPLQLHAPGRVRWHRPPRMAAPADRHAAGRGTGADRTAARQRRHRRLQRAGAGPARRPARLAAYWAVTEQNHATAVKAGENEGVTLKHDFVVREYRPVAAWKAVAGAPVTLAYTPATPADPAHPRQLNLVVVDGDTGRPVQALKLGC